MNNFLTQLNLNGVPLQGKFNYISTSIMFFRLSLSLTREMFTVQIEITLNIFDSYDTNIDVLLCQPTNLCLRLHRLQTKHGHLPGHVYLVMHTK